MKTQIRSNQLEEFFMLSSSHPFFPSFCCSFFSPLLSFLFLFHHWQILIGLFLSISFLSSFFFSFLRFYGREKCSFYSLWSDGGFERQLNSCILQSINMHRVIFYFFPALQRLQCCYVLHNLKKKKKLSLQFFFFSYFLLTLFGDLYLFKSYSFSDSAIRVLALPSPKPNISFEIE